MGMKHKMADLSDVLFAGLSTTTRIPTRSFDVMMVRGMVPFLCRARRLASCTQRGHRDAAPSPSPTLPDRRDFFSILPAFGSVLGGHVPFRRLRSNLGRLGDDRARLERRRLCRSGSRSLLGIARYLAGDALTSGLYLFAQFVVLFRHDGRTASAAS